MIDIACRLSNPTEQTEVLGSKENNLAEVEPSAANDDDPWKTLAPGDTIEDIRLQPQPPVPKFKSRVVSQNFFTSCRFFLLKYVCQVLEIEEAYFKSWYKDAKKARGCFGWFKYFPNHEQSLLKFAVCRG